jgi:polyhydroxybutyrate depolymerase
MRKAHGLCTALLALFCTACGASASGAPSTPRGLTTIQLSSGGHQRSFLLYVPPGDSPQHPLPLVIAYHGAGDTAANESTETDLLSIAKRSHDMLLAYPQGYEDTWNEGTGHTPAERAGINDVAFTSAMLQEIESHHAVNPREVVAMGISNGALLSEYLGCELAAELTLIVPVEGEIPVSVSHHCSPTRPISVYEVHGTSDPSIPYGGGHFDGAGGGTTVLSAPDSAARWAELDHCSTTPQQSRSGQTVTKTYTGCHDGVHVTLATVLGGQHQWPADIGQTVVNLLATLPQGRPTAKP